MSVMLWRKNKSWFAAIQGIKGEKPSKDWKIQYWKALRRESCDECLFAGESVAFQIMSPRLRQWKGFIHETLASLSLSLRAEAVCWELFSCTHQRTNWNHLFSRRSPSECVEGARLVTEGEIATVRVETEVEKSGALEGGRR